MNTELPKSDLDPDPDPDPEPDPEPDEEDAASCGVVARRPKGNKITIKNVKPADSVAKIKKAVKGETGISPSKQVLEDKNGKALKDIGLKLKWVLHLFLMHLVQ